MSTEDNKRVVQTVFEKFGQGDVPGLLEMITEDAEWVVSGPEIVPYFGKRRGREGALEFFRQLGGNVEFERFEPGEFIAEGDHVVVLGFERGRVRGTGKTFDNDWVILFTVRDGMVAGVRIYENTAAIAAAFS